MTFTYKDYKALLNRLKRFGCVISQYDKYDPAMRSVIMRHDIDFCLKKATAIAEIEQECEVQSTFFVLVCTDFYNVFSANNQRIIRKLESCGHEVGLHFDETRYPEDMGKPDKIIDRIIAEAELLAYVTCKPVTSVAMHRPTKEIIESDLQIPGMINAYSTKFMKEFKYVSDSRMKWREPVEEYIETGTHEKLHILTHPFWYNDDEISMSENIKRFIENANRDRYNCLNENITDFAGIIRRVEIEKC